tara:strand:- start:3147 stop:3866 length:720 start_codon:yes stop_codon:yes gene_type:complete
LVKIAKEIGIFLSAGLLLVLLFNYLIMPIYINERNTVLTPDLEGLDIDTARSISKSKKIEAVVVDTIFTNDIKEDIILEQFPSSGKEVKSGRAIKLKITSLNKKVIVPDLLGKTLRASEIELNQIGIVVDSVYYSFNPNYPKGIISWQSPAPLDSIRKGLGVRLEVSRGLAPNDFVPVPNLIGLFYNEALDKIKDSNLEKGSIKFVDYDKSVPNIVLNQNPKEGTKISQNSKINLVISK